MLVQGRGRVGVLCECCLSIAGRPPTAAAYRWTGHSGNVTHLCVNCCAIWRENGRDDPSLSPQRIETVPTIPVTDIRWEAG